MNVKEHYINALAKKGYKADASQLNAISKLQNLAVQLNSYSIKEPNVSSGLFSGLLKSFKTKLSLRQKDYICGVGLVVAKALLWIHFMPA